MPFETKVHKLSDREKFKLNFERANEKLQRLILKQLPKPMNYTDVPSSKQIKNEKSINFLIQLDEILEEIKNIGKNIH